MQGIYRARGLTKDHLRVNSSAKSTRAPDKPDIRDAVCADFDFVKMKVHRDELQADCTLLEALPRVKAHKLILCNNLTI